MTEDENKELMCLLMEAAAVIANPAPQTQRQASDLTYRLLGWSRKLWKTSLDNQGVEIPHGH
jgi:hypothetical protein